MTDRFARQTALVTGSAAGIGYPIAARLATEGAHVVLADLDASAVQAAARRLAEAHGADVLGIAVDVGDEADAERLVETVVQRHGQIDILVNNAGITRDNLLFRMSDDDWDSVIRVHLRGMFLCTRAAQRHMVARRFGKIINLSSTSALGNRGQTNYSTAKAGVQAFTRAASIEPGPFGINVNAIAPGFVETDMTRRTAERRGIDYETCKRERARNCPLGRVGTPEDVANVAAFLCSEDASYVSGQIIYVKGGPETVRG